MMDIREVNSGDFLSMLPCLYYLDLVVSPEFYNEPSNSMLRTVRTATVKLK